MTAVLRAASARQRGFRMPAEWEPHARCWMQWPYREDFIWEDLARTQAAYANVARAIRRFEPVTMMVREEDLAQARAVCGDGFDWFLVSLDDAWARDSGPVFVKNGDQLAACVFQFNAWGGQYDRFANDAAVAHRVAEALGIPTLTVNAFMEGGGIAVDGQGTILTSESTMLNGNRNPGLTKAEAERILCDAVGGTRVIWVPGDSEDVETGGHIDAIACFVAPGVVLCKVGSPERPERARELQENWRALAAARDAHGRRLTILPIGEADDAGAGRSRYCRSYANFYIANGGVVFPRHGVASDIKAEATLRRVFRSRKVVGVDVRDIAVGGGSIHCITQQQPL